MSISMHQVAAPLLTNSLAALTRILEKGAADAEARKIDPSVFLNARLAPDMLTLTRQVQIATDMAKLAFARLAGVEAPKFEDTEASFSDLLARVTKTILFLGTVGATAVDGTEEKEIAFKAGSQEMKFSGQDYLMKWVLPNVFFHVTTAYDILRHNGVQIGKRDYLGSV